MTSEKFDVDEAGKRMGVSKFTVRALIRTKKLAAYRIGRRVVVDSEDVAKFLAAHRVEARNGDGR